MRSKYWKESLVVEFADDDKGSAVEYALTDG